ncbi:ATP-grasp domain-containing protein [Alcaligenaceae bacterium]|nr:ATP-grasp domain-containing protein [Alcaligenaceae bacterium]
MKRILIANRGEIARRIIRTAHAMGIETVAVYSDPDSQALHVREATFAHALGGETSADSYLRFDKLLDAAQRTGADAIHPGYGFLSENAQFAEAVIQQGLCWIGPPPQAIRTLGNKAAAKALARTAGVPCLPGYDGQDQSQALLAAHAQQIGYPIMVKAVAGGGGRGMRLVSNPQAFADALTSAQSEALAGFGCDHVLLERALLSPRHVEVQVFADLHGHCIHLGERDCSVQRRNQKIIEEAPSPAVNAEMRERMGQCAVMLAQAAGYAGAGTVEFLVEDGEFFLMEMNTRLQVEHPVTEAITGLDLVEWQIRIARGEHLPLTQDAVRWQGHAIEVRLCAEDEQFVPCSGTVALFQSPSATTFKAQPPGIGPQLRFDHAIEAGLAVTPFYDSMLGKLIIHAADRNAAIDGLIQALGNTRILGLPTNRAFLAACLDHPDFRAGQALVPFLQDAASPLRQILAAREESALVPAALSTQIAHQGQQSLLPCPLERPLRVQHRDKSHELGLRFEKNGRTLVRDGNDTEQWNWLPAAHPQERMRWRSANAELGIYAVEISAGQWHVQTSLGQELWLEDTSTSAGARNDSSQAATELRAPFNGRVIRIGAAAGESLTPDDAAITIDSMKLEHMLACTAPVKVLEVLVDLEQQVTRGQLLMRFESIG